MQKLTFFIFLFFPGFLNAQFNNYWSYNFNEESSLIAGAVVGGGAGASAIFYNPAIISEISASKLSLNASLFAYDINKAENIIGEGIDFESTRFYPIPRYVSYMHKPKNHPNWDLEFAYLNVANNEFSAINYTEKDIDILTYLPGIEHYVAYTELKTVSRKDFFGAGGSIKLSKNLFLGSSMFVSVNSKYSLYQLDINAYPTKSLTGAQEDETPYYNASSVTQEMVKFNDYRLLWKFGLLYKQPRFSIGLNITTPSVGGIYSDGKKVMRQQSQDNITNPDTGEPMQNFLVMDYAEKKDVTVAARTPLSVAAGCTFYSSDNKNVLYTTVEFFNNIDSYRMVETDENTRLGEGSILEHQDFSEWLTFVDGANSVFNVALGYRSYLKNDLMLLSGFKTDFNYKKNRDSGPFNPDKSIKTIDVDFYHFTTGLTLRIKGQDITAGLQYSLGFSNNTKQLANVSDPVEFNFQEMSALQGTRTNTVKSVYNSFTLLLAASFNFNGKQKE
jgi:hypothetical protein